MEKQGVAELRTRVRRMTVDDVPKVFHLGEAIYNAQKHPFLYRTWDPYEVAYLFSSEIELSLVAETRGEVVGFCLSTTIEKPNKPWRYGYLIWLGVSPSHQQQGVGRKLMAELLRRMKAKRVKFVLVDTEEANTGATGFFLKMGFDVRQRRVWMWKNLGRAPLSYDAATESISSVNLNEGKK